MGAHLSLTRPSWARSARGKHAPAPCTAIFDRICELRKFLIVDGHWRARRRDISPAATSTRDPAWAERSKYCSGAPPQGLGRRWEGHSPPPASKSSRPRPSRTARIEFWRRTFTLRFEGLDLRLGVDLSPDSESRGPPAGEPKGFPAGGDGVLPLRLKFVPFQSDTMAIWGIPAYRKPQCATLI